MDSIAIDCKIFTLGPEGTNGHEAALCAKQMLNLGEQCTMSFCQSHQDILHLMDKAKVDFGIVAVENSTNGHVREVLNYWLPCVLNGHNPPPFKVVGEVEIPVKHCLMVKGDLTIAHLDGVISHTHALGQCTEFINNNNLVQIPVHSTALAARLIATNKGYSRYGAIASRLAAKLNNLAILDDDITDNSLYGENITRFYILGYKVPPKTGSDWTALLVQVPDESGAMNRITNVISANGINMSAIQSISFGALRKYAFYVEMEGHQSDRSVQAALSSIANITNDKFVVLGSFPKAQQTIQEIEHE